MAAPWVILRRLLYLAFPRGEEAELPGAIFAALRAPPRLTILRVDESVRPCAVRENKAPYVVAAGPSALLLCFSVGGSPPIVTDELFMAQGFAAPADPRQHPTTGTVQRVPPRTDPASMPVACNFRSLGLTASLLGGYVVSELVVTTGSEHAKLIRLFSGDNQWFDTDLSCPVSSESETRVWSPSGVVAHDGKLWWFDLSWGLLSCDPRDMRPALVFHDLPPDRRLRGPLPLIHTMRRVAVSDDKLRYVDMARDNLPDGGVSEEEVFVWTASPDPTRRDGRIVWEKTYAMSFREIWSDGSYLAKRLPAKIPEIVLVSPRNASVVYFLLGRTLFGVDVPAHRIGHVVTDCPRLVDPPTSLCGGVVPWDLPPSSANGLVDSIVPLHEAMTNEVVDKDAGHGGA